MISIGKYITANYRLFGLQDVKDLVLTKRMKNNDIDDRQAGQVDNTGGYDPVGKWLVMQAMRTTGDTTRKVPFGNLLAPGVTGEQFMTLIEFECRTRAANANHDFYWNQARELRDQVYNALAGTNRGGITIPRYDWSDKDNPVKAGEIWFEVDSGANSPIEDPLEDQDDPANKSIFLTYKVHWWKPI